MKETERYWKERKISERNKITIEAVESPEKRMVHGLCRCSQTAVSHGLGGSGISSEI